MGKSDEGVPDLQTMSGDNADLSHRIALFTLTWPCEGIIDNPAEHVAIEPHPDRGR